ncbi:hypothetical protein IKO50_07390, partial [bacterium]|nr:hypothetical protein [bacterium]
MSGIPEGKPGCLNDENASNDDNNDILELPSITNQDDLSDLLSLQELLYSEAIDTSSLQVFLEEIKKKYSIKEIDHQIILAFSLDYSRIPILIPFLSRKTLEKVDFIHADQEFIYQLIQAKISFPLLILWEKCLEFAKWTDGDYECINPPSAEMPSINSDIGVQELVYYHPPHIFIEEKIKKILEESGLVFMKEDTDFYYDDEDKLMHDHHQHKDDELIDIIDHDDMERLRILTSDLDFNYQIDKENLLYGYSSIPILSYSIEKSAIKCFKYILINGANPLLKAQILFAILDGGQKLGFSHIDVHDVMDSFGFAGAQGNIQFIKILESHVGHLTKDIIKGCTQFHKNDILSWVLKENPSFAQDGLI